MIEILMMIIIILGTGCLVFGLSYGFGCIFDGIDPIFVAWCLESIVSTILISRYIYKLIF